MKNFLKAFYRKKLLFWPVMIVVAFIGYNIASGGQKNLDEMITVARGDVAQTVTATGSVRPKNGASLRFESAGTIASLNVAVGDTVYKGQLLASLNAGDLRQKITQAEAEFSAAQIALANAGQGLSDTGIRNEQELATAYADALAGLGEVLNLTQTAHDTMRNIFNNASINSRIESLDKIDDAHDVIVYALRKLVPTSSRLEIETALGKVYAPLISLQQVSVTLIKELSSLSSTQTNEAYRTSATEAQADVNDAVARVAAYSKAISDAGTDGVLEGNTSSASYRTAQAAVETARAAVAIARANLGSATLVAPIAGVIASKGKNIGEGVTATDQIYYLIGDGGLEVTANIPEIDIAKVAMGNKATVVLDAYGSEVPFMVTVSAIDPAETVIDGVATYKTTFTFDAEDVRIRSGMTANIIVATQEKKSVVVIPFRAISLKEGKRFVRLVRGEERSDVEVKLGLRGNDGTVEVVSGVKVGDVIVIEKK